MKPLIVIVALALALAPTAVASSAPVRVPTEIHGLQVRPFIIDWTGDGSGWLGGSSGRSSTFSYHDIGRLHWTQYNATGGRAFGVVWAKPAPNCHLSNAQCPLVPEGKTGVHVYRPRDGVFTRMTFKIGRHVITLDATNNGGFWQW